jgi:TetR/AcrR family transcriptional regulator
VQYKFTSFEDEPIVASTASQPNRRTQVRAIATQRAILKSALKEFARVGFSGASLRKIGDAADVNHRLIQHHFGSKLDLWKATATHTFEKFQDRLDRRVAGLEGVNEAETLLLMFREFILHAASEPELNKFMLQANDEPERMRWLVETLLEPSKHHYMNALRRAQELGVFVSGNPQLLWYIFVGAATSVFAFHEEFEQVNGINPFDEDLLEEHIETVLALFFRDLT